MKKKILIVDDNSTNLYMLKSLLEGEGFDVTAATNGQEALDMAHADPPDLVVSDILMPVMDGYALCRQWKSDELLKQIPIIFYTATYTEPKDEIFALSLGADRFVLKPQEPDILMNIIKEVLEENYAVKQVAIKPLGEEMESFRQYNEILFKKLEKKMLDLETANRKLKCLEEQYRLSFENVTDVIWTIDADFIVRKMSPSVEKMLGYKPQDFIGRSVSDLVKIFAPESTERAMAEMCTVLGGQTIPASVYSLVAKDGTITYCEISGSPSLRDGKIVGIASVIRDITRRKQAEDALEREHTLLRNLIDNVPDRIYAKDLEGRFIICNAAMICRMGMTSMTELLGKSDFDLLPPEMAQRFHADEQAIIRSGIPMINREEPLAIEDGAITRWNLATKVSLLDKQGNTIGIVGVGREITDRKQAEQALRESEEKYRSLFEHLQDAILLTRPDGSILDVNQAACEMFGRSADELKAVGRSGLVDVTDPALHAALNERANMGSAHAEITMLRANGEKFPADITSTIFTDRNGQQKTSMIIRDITDRTKSVERMRKSLAATVNAIAVTVERRDPYTAGHQHRVADLARSIATEIGLTSDQIEGIRMAAVIHDIGKISIPAEILSMPRKLTNTEFSLIKTHAQSGYDIIKDIEFPWPVARIVLEHHERMDGSGYPNGLTGENILIESRILSVADVVEAIASHRPYRPTLGLDVALEEIAKNKGIFYDPEVVHACLRLFKEKGYKLSYNHAESEGWAMR